MELFSATFTSTSTGALRQGVWSAFLLERILYDIDIDIDIDNNS